MKDDQFSSRDSWLVFVSTLAVILWRVPGLEFFLGSADHGYQLNLGYQITLGKFPFVDFVFHYGPLTAYTSAIGIWLSGGLLGELFICAVGHAVCVALIYYLTSTYSSRLCGAAAAISAVVLLTRLYKWYYWLFPLLSLYLFHRLLHASDEKSGCSLSFIAGLISGIAFLYRFDLGLACFSFVFLAGLFVSQKTISLPHKSNLVSLCCLVAGLMLPLAMWPAILVANGGLSALATYFIATAQGTKGALSALSLPFPVFDWTQPWSTQSGVALACLMVPTIYLLGGIVALALICTKRPCGGNHVFLLATVILGIGIFPQALHRSDIHHLRQILPPAIIAGALIVSTAWRMSKAYWKYGIRTACALAVAVILWTIIAVGETGGADLSAWTDPVLTRWRGLAAEFHPKTGNSVAALAGHIRNHTSERASILVFGNAPQVYFFSRRTMSGIVPCYLGELLSYPASRKNTMTNLKTKPPEAVIVQATATGNALDPAPYWPEVADFIAKNYTRIEAEIGGWQVRLRPHPTSLSD
jgi:hypothetical protein